MDGKLLFLDSFLIFSGGMQTAHIPGASCERGEVVLDSPSIPLSLPITPPIILIIIIVVVVAPPVPLPPAIRPLC